MADVLVVYWTGTGNTEIMAEKIAEGIKQTGASVDVKLVSDIEPSECLKYPKVAFGCPAMGDEQLEEDEFEPFFQEVEGDLSGKKVALFGSYSWADGEWMRKWTERTLDAGANLFRNEGLAVYGTPDDDGEEQCVEFGKKFAEF